MRCAFPFLVELVRERAEDLLRQQATALRHGRHRRFAGGDEGNEHGGNAGGWALVNNGARIRTPQR